ncbi:MAG: FAD-dependent monooxygenase [Candidatus Binatus sp.]|uniref:FAD-dependent monooxygenase n=1 Tax=Candidatus Binatus sp. TaxID=2811406 RepID=UPI003C7920DB
MADTTKAPERQVTGDYDVIVAGAGPVGLTLAIDLGRRGVKCLLVERNRITAPYPKMDRSNARTMEFYRRIGIVDRVRALGYPPEIPMDVFIVTRLCDPPLAVLRYPSVAECREQIAACRDCRLPLEPYQLVSQNKLEPLLKEVADATPNVTVRYGCELIDFTQDPTGVNVAMRVFDRSEQTLRAGYLVGCDGGSSTVRKKLGIQLEGRGGIQDVCQVIFGSKDLFERIPIGKGRHYNFAHPNGSTIVVQGCRTEFTFHTSLPADTDFEPVLRDLIGFPCEIEIRIVVPWRQHLLVAERYRDGRVFIAGDAVHLVIPTGGLGMNTGVGDAFDLSWKLTGVIQGWGGSALLDAYEQERRPIGLRNRDAAGWAAAGVPIWRRLITPNVRDDTPAGAALRAEIAASANINHRRMHDMRGVEFGYSYAGSPLIATESTGVEQWDTCVYTPHTRPGVRIPHMWLKDGRAIQDLLGDDYTLLDLRGDCETDGLERAFHALGAPFKLLRLDEPEVRQVYGCSVLLLRPDLHIAWRGDRAPENPAALATKATGH